MTHQSPCNAILKIINKKGNTNIPKNDGILYPKGGLTLIFNKSEWDFKPLNWNVSSE